MICVVYPNCLGGGMQTLVMVTDDIHGYENYNAILVRNNDYHNSTNYITIDEYHLDYQKLAVRFRNYPSKKVYKHLSEIDGGVGCCRKKQEPESGQVFYNCGQKQTTSGRTGNLRNYESTSISNPR